MTAGHAIDPSLQGAVSEHTFMLVVWIFWFLSLIALAVRITLYVRARRKPQVDDYLLMLSVACLTVATLWMQTRYGDAYEVIALSVDPFKAGIPTNLTHVIYRAQLVNFVYGPLIWTAIFAAKWSYLWFFRQLIHQIKPLKVYWWFVFVFTWCVYGVCLAGVFLACPYRDINAFKCNQQPMIGRALNLAVVSVALDIVTDIMIVSIPVWLLWKVKIRLAQKAGLACFLCLSIVIAIMAIIRVSPLRAGEHPNIAVHSIWVDMMGQVEACVAVILVSLTAFRYFFVMHERRRHEQQDGLRPWFRSHLNHVLPHHRRRLNSEDETTNDGSSLPRIPSATLTGIQSFIRNVTGSRANPSRPSRLTTTSSMTSTSYMPTPTTDEIRDLHGPAILSEKTVYKEEIIRSDSYSEEVRSPLRASVEPYRIGAFEWEK